MATYSPPQPYWKRAVAGTLDFLLAYFGFGMLIQRLTTSVSPRDAAERSAWVSLEFNLEGGPATLWLALVIGYFVLLGRTGGTIFQRLLGMKRV